MTRTNAREIAVHLIYAMQCSGASAEEIIAARLDAPYYDLLAQESEIYAERPKGKLRKYIETVVTGVQQTQQALDAELESLSERWSVNRISSLARAMIELAMYEALYLDDVPMNVAIHEAVVLAKKYEDADTVAFVNGVLGAFSRKHTQTTGSEETTC